MTGQKGKLKDTIDLLQATKTATVMVGLFAIGCVIQHYDGQIMLSKRIEDIKLHIRVAVEADEESTAEPAAPDKRDEVHYA